MKSELEHAHSTAQFNGVTPDWLYKVSVNAVEPARATGQPVRSAPEGSAFSGLWWTPYRQLHSISSGKLAVQF
jgi:hypothetical protein